MLAPQTLLESGEVTAEELMQIIFRAEMARFLFAIRLEEARDKEEEFLALQRRFV